MFHVDRAEERWWHVGSNDQQDMVLPLLVRDRENSVTCQPSQNRNANKEPRLHYLTLKCKTFTEGILDTILGTCLLKMLASSLRDRLWRGVSL